MQNPVAYQFRRFNEPGPELLRARRVGRHSVILSLELSREMPTVILGLSTTAIELDESL